MIDSIRNRRARARAAVAALALASLLGAFAPALAADSPPLTGVVNVNTATVEELQLLPGIGEARAQALVEARKRRGGFKSLEQLKEVKGIGDGSLIRLRPHVRFDGKTTARRN
jgi:competence protein ComEA